MNFLASGITGFLDGRANDLEKEAAFHQKLYEFSRNAMVVAQENLEAKEL